MGLSRAKLTLSYLYSFLLKPTFLAYPGFDICGHSPTNFFHCFLHYCCC